jgi:hypothetical protein
MRHFIFAVLILSVASISIANASLTYQDVQKYVDNYNSRIGGTSDVVKGLLTVLLGSEKINANIALTNGTIFSVGFEIENALVSKTVLGGVANPSIVITTNESTIDRIKSSDNPIAAFQDEMNGGRLKIEGTNWITNSKLGAVLSSASVLEFFYSVIFG